MSDISSLSLGGDIKTCLFVDDYCGLRVEEDLSLAFIYLVDTNAELNEPENAPELRHFWPSETSKTPPANYQQVCFNPQ